MENYLREAYGRKICEDVELPTRFFNQSGAKESVGI